jgi:hypothetical protein
LPILILFGLNFEPPLPKLCGVNFDNLQANGDGILKIYVGTNDKVKESTYKEL